jgi:hypothetical protein
LHPPECEAQRETQRKAQREAPSFAPPVNSVYNVRRAAVNMFAEIYAAARPMPHSARPTVRIAARMAHGGWVAKEVAKDV